MAAKHAEAGGRTEAAKPDQAVATDTNQRPIGPLALTLTGMDPGVLTGMDPPQGGLSRAV